MKDYRLFREFIEQNLPTMFREVDMTGPLYRQLEAQMEAYNQTFHIIDVFRNVYVFADPRLGPLVGLPYGTPASEFNISILHKAIHPEERPRHITAISRIITIAFSMLQEDAEDYYFLRNFRMLDADGKYNHHLLQSYIFSVGRGIPDVLSLIVFTNINTLVPGKTGIIHFLGQEPTLFRYPDEELLKLKIDLTPRELWVIDKISRGLNSSEIAEQLFVSKHTIDTHRRNMLRKTGLKKSQALIKLLQDRGIL